ncbi:disease resistance TIR-NBS-LRR class family protein [Tanacetum coccineum]
MESLLLLNIDGCDMMRTLPLSIGFFAGLRVLSMISSNSVMKPDRKLEQISINRILTYNNLHIQGITHLSSLRVLDFKNNHLAGDEFSHYDLHISWPFLEEMDISRNLYTSVPASISRLSHLKHLDLTGCINLKELNELPSLIQVLRAESCTSLKKIGDLSSKYKWLFKISLFRCPKLLDNQESQGHVANLLMKYFVQKCAAVTHRLSIAVPESKIPNWFSNKQLGNTVTLNITETHITKILGLAVCCLFRAPLTETFTYLEMEFRLSGEKWRDEVAKMVANGCGVIAVDMAKPRGTGERKIPPHPLL